MPPLPERAPLFSVLEYAPGFIVYALHGPYWLWLMLRYRGIALPAIANPNILVGGLVGESKTDQQALLGEIARSYFAPFITITASDTLEAILHQIAAAKLSFPLVVKPDVGRNGRGVKIVHTPEELHAHLLLFPSDVKMIVQRYVADEGEAGVFYVRYPHEPKGHITSLTLKYFPSVVGDGKATLRELIKRDPRASKISRIYFRRNRKKLNQRVPEGQTYRLVSVGNHVRGSLFIDGANHITKEMEDVFDQIAKDIKGFYFGRFDVRFSNLGDVKRGKNFTIIEYNGASSEPTHIWDPRTSAFTTFKELLRHWKMAFAIGAQLRAQGVKPIPLGDILHVHFAETKLVNQYPDEE